MKKGRNFYTIIKLSAIFIAVTIIILSAASCSQNNTDIKIDVLTKPISDTYNHTDHKFNAEAIYHDLIITLHENPETYFEYYYKGRIGALSKNEFVIADINQDGIEDLLYKYCSTNTHAPVYIWSYNPETEETYLIDELSEYCNFYLNGYVRRDMPNHYLYGETIWPYTLLKYDKETEKYLKISSAECYDKYYMEQLGEAFPSEQDIDNDGTIYYVTTDDNMEALTKEEYDEFEQKYIPDNLIIDLEWKTTSDENLYAMKSDSSASNNNEGNSSIKTHGNIVNDGLVAEDGEYIYYQNHKDNWYIYKTYGNFNIPLNADNSWCINVQEDYVYYANVDDNSSIYKIKNDGTERQKLNSDNCGLVMVDGEYIYYQNVSVGNKIFKIKTDGTNREQLSDEAISCMYLYGGWIYYCGNDDFIYRIKTDGSQKEQLNSDKSAYINVYDDWIYYRNDSSYQRIYRMRIDGSEKTMFCGDAASYINVSNGMVYYQNLSDNNYLYGISTSTAQKKQLNYDDSRYINVTDNDVYYRISSDTKQLNKLPLSE